MKAIVTGSTGFVGKHLVIELQNNGWEVIGFDGEIRNYENIRESFDSHRPDAVFHLAAQAFVPESFTSPQRAMEVNVIGSLNLLEAVRNLGLKTRIHLAGTSEEYGGGAVTELARLEPQSPYAISKMAMDHLGQLYADSYGMNVVVTRAFNHTGPGRGEQYAESSFARQIVEIELGRREVLKHGNLDSIRNYTDVRDVVKAYRQAIMLESGVYNICSEHNFAINYVLDTLISLSEADIKIEVNDSLYRPVDFSFKQPNCDKFAILTGWKPEIRFRRTMSDLLNYWREQLS